MPTRVTQAVYMEDPCVVYKAPLANGQYSPLGNAEATALRPRHQPKIKDPMGEVGLWQREPQSDAWASVVPKAMASQDTRPGNDWTERPASYSCTDLRFGRCVRAETREAVLRDQ